MKELRSARARRALAAVALATVFSGSYAGPADAQHQAALHQSIAPPAGFRGFDLTITPIRSHGFICPDPTVSCTVGRFVRDQDQRIVQLIADDGRTSTVARIDIWNWQPHGRRIRIIGAESTGHYRVRYYAAGHDVTKAVVAGKYRTPRTRPGTKSALRLVVTMRRWVPNGRVTTFPVRTLPQYAISGDGTHMLIPGDLLAGSVQSYPYDAVPALPPA